VGSLYHSVHGPTVPVEDVKIQVEFPLTTDATLTSIPFVVLIDLVEPGVICGRHIGLNS
jgi:hypothetical protein